MKGNRLVNCSYLAELNAVEGAEGKFRQQTTVSEEKRSFFLGMGLLNIKPLKNRERIAHFSCCFSKQHITNIRALLDRFAAREMGDSLCTLGYQIAY